MKKPQFPKPPVEPSKPIMPNPPSKTIEENETINVEERFTVAELLAKIPANISHDKVTIELESDYDEYDGGGSSYLRVYYKKVIDNKFYDNQYKQYQLKLDKYNIKLLEYKENHKEYLIKYTKYLEEKKAYNEYVSQKEYNDALKIVSAFKKKVRPIETEIVKFAIKKKKQ
jgi:hypothetical protein